MKPDPILSKPEHRQACAMVSRCCQCRGSCGNAGIHRDGASVAGGLGAGPRPQPSWLAERPWIWIWVVFLILISVWAGFIMLAVKNQPASVPLSPAVNSRSHSHG